MTLGKTRARHGSWVTAADLLLGSWRRTLIAAGVLVAVFAGVFVVVATLGDLRHANFPGHPYPPAGFYRNPLPGQDELVNAAEAARVKADFERDGQLELQAFAQGNGALLSEADTGNSLTRLKQLLDQNTAQGIVRSYQNHVDHVSVGRLADPVTPGVSWCVEERGETRVIDTAKANGRQISTQTYRFAGRFWLARVGDRYLITDADVTNQPSAGG